MRYERPVRPSSWRVAGWLLSSVVIVVLGVPGLVLLVGAEMPRGRLTGLAAVLLAGLPVLVLRARSSSAVQRAAAAVAAMAVVVIAGLLWATPTRLPAPGATVSNFYVTDTRAFGRWTLPNMVPELDQLRFGFTAMSALDPIFTAEQAGVLRRHSSQLYHEMAADPDFRSLGSVMGEAYTEFLGGEVDDRHCYLYVPAKLPREKPAPVLVFFHGSGGNFKAYLWILKEVADRTNCILVAPTSGFGNWDTISASDGLDRGLVAARSRALIDEARVHAVGLSNGGRALSHLLGAKAPLRSVVAVSPVLLDIPVIQRPPVLVITGESDDRVPLDYVRGHVAALERRRLAVTLRRYPADHFLFFTHRDRMIEELVGWLTGN